MRKNVRILATGITLGLLAAVGFGLGVRAQSAGSCATGYPTCWFDSVCSDRCYQFECSSDLCENMPVQRDCSICVNPM